jgi:exodeoxyribonuclease VIII
MKTYSSDTLSNEEYHADKAISRSGIMEFKKSPYHFNMNIRAEKKKPKESTPAMVFGSAFHAFMLEHDKFEAEYIIKPERVLLKEVGPAAYETYKNELAEIEETEKTIISQADYSKILEMAYFVNLNEQARDLINGAVYERSFFWVDKESELRVKARPDILHSNMIVDLKTCFDASPRAFQRAIVDGGFHIQGAMVRDAVRAVEGRDISNVVYLAVEKTYPY